MRRLLWTIVATVALVAVVTGCSGAQRHDSRLTAADSLLRVDPDSALAVLNTLPDSAFTSEGDRAYHALLLTQARYKCFEEITAADDSTICQAVNYYCLHKGEREKLTRAYIYKGAVMEELGRVDSAMFYYKTAEVCAERKDYTNLGQINVRIGNLYRNSYGDKQVCAEKYRQALEYYKKTDNKPLQLVCLLNLGSCSGITHIGDPEKYLTQATQLAIELKDSFNYYSCQELLCRQLAYNGEQLPRAKQIAFNCLNNYRDYVTEDLLLDISDIYIKSGKPDSARYYLDMVSEDASLPNLEQVKTRKYMLLSHIYSQQGDSIRSSYYDKLSHQVSDSIYNDQQKYQIQQIENRFNYNRDSNILSRISQLQWIIFGLAAAAIAVVAALIAAHRRRLRNIKAVIKELKNTDALSPHDDLLNRTDVKDTAIGNLAANLVSILKMCVSETKGLKFTSQLARQIKETIIDAADEDFWNELRSYLDREHNGIISKIAEQPGIKENDLKFIELSCFGFSYIEIAIIMDYTPRYVINKRKIIADKLGLHGPLMEHLNDLMSTNGKYI